MSADSTTAAGDDAVKVLTGGCPCANLQYEIRVSVKEGYPSQSLCHCLFCKKTSGASFTRNILVPPTHIRILSGEPKLYIHNKSASQTDTTTTTPTPNSTSTPQSTSQSTSASNQAAQTRWHFCPECGGQIYSETSFMPGLAVVKVGTLDRPDLISHVGMQIFCRSRDAWVGGKWEGKEGEGGCFETLPPPPS